MSRSESSHVHCVVSLSENEKHWKNMFRSKKISPDSSIFYSKLWAIRRFTPISKTCTSFVLVHYNRCGLLYRFHHVNHTMFQWRKQETSRHKRRPDRIDGVRASLAQTTAQQRGTPKKLPHPLPHPPDPERWWRVWPLDDEFLCSSANIFITVS